MIATLILALAGGGWRLNISEKGNDAEMVDSMLSTALGNMNEDSLYMWIKSLNKKDSIKMVLCFLSYQFASCADCSKFEEMSVSPREGKVRVDSIYLKSSDHAHTAISHTTKQKLLFNEGSFSRQPELGDSLVKRVGETEYALYTTDSVYVQRYDCANRHAIIISKEKK